MKEKPLYVRCPVSKREFEIDRNTLEPKTCSWYAPYDDLDPNAEYMDIHKWDLRHVKDPRKPPRKQKGT